MKQHKLFSKKIIIFGILSVIILLWPPIIAISIIIFPVFFALVALPCIFIYSFSFILINRKLIRFGSKRWILSLTTLILLAISIPAFFNYTTYKKINELTKEDKEITKKLHDISSISFISDNRVNLSLTCAPICQKLLYNNVSKIVIKGSKHRPKDKGFKYYIERRDDCPAISNTIKAVSNRILQGECLITERANIYDADIIFESIAIRESGKRNILDLIYSPMHGTRVKVSTNNQIIYQRTKLEANLLAYPLMISPIGTGHGFNFYTAWARYKKTMYDTSIKDNELIFGDAINEIKQTIKIDDADAYKNKINLMYTALNNQGNEKLAGHTFFEDHLRNLYISKKVPSDEDIELVTEALKDDRITDLFYLSRFTGKLGNNIPESIIQEMANRIIRNRKGDTSNAIRYLPNGKAANISLQLKKIIQDQKLGNKAWGAVSRLSDVGVEAIDFYMPILEKWASIETIKNRNEKTNTYRNMSKLVKGTLIGVCRLGKDALVTRDILFRILKRKNGTLDPLVIEAILEIGEEEEITKIYKDTDNWLEIGRIIGERKRKTEQKRTFCGGSEI